MAVRLGVLDTEVNHAGRPARLAHIPVREREPAPTPLRRSAPVLGVSAADPDPKQENREDRERQLMKRS